MEEVVKMSTEYITMREAVSLVYWRLLSCRVDVAIMSTKPKIEAVVEATMTLWRVCCRDE